MANLRREVRGLSVGAGLLAAGAGAQAGGSPMPVYLSARTQIHARSNFTGAFNLPNAAFFTNSTPSITDPVSGGNAHLAFKVGVIGSTNTQGVWKGFNGAGSIVYTSPVNANITDASINGARRIAFAINFSGADDGVYVIEPSLGNVAVRQFSTANPAALNNFGPPSLNNAGEIGLRGLVGLVAQAYYRWSPEPAPQGTFTQMAAESPLSQAPPGPFSFLFSSAFNNAGDMAGKCRRGDLGQTEDSRPDEVRVFHAGVSGTVIARDRDADALSNFASFDNSVALNDNGQVAFIATLVSPANTRAVYVGDGGALLEIARQGVNGVGNIEFFSPSINNRGQVAFRAFDSSGKRAVFVGDGATLRIAARQDDILTIDAGQLAQISENNPSDPCFGGSPRINRRGDVAFMAALIPPGQFGVELGSGAFIARGILPGDTDFNDAVNFADLNTVLSQFGQAGAPGGGAGSLAGDANFDGAVNFADLNIVLSNFGATI